MTELPKTGCENCRERPGEEHHFNILEGEPRVTHEGLDFCSEDCAFEHLASKHGAEMFRDVIRARRMIIDLQHALEGGHLSPTDTVEELHLVYAELEPYNLEKLA